MGEGVKLYRHFEQELLKIGKLKRAWFTTFNLDISFFEKYNTYFVRSDLVQFVDSYASLISEKKIVLLGNLPYIPEKTHDENNPDSVKKREPRMAFV